MERHRYYAGSRYRPGARHDASLDGTAAVQYAAPGPGRVRVSPLVSRDWAWNNHLEPASFGLADREVQQGGSSRISGLARRVSVDTGESGHSGEYSEGQPDGDDRKGHELSPGPARLGLVPEDYERENSASKR